MRGDENAPDKVEGLVTVKVVQVQVLSPALLQHKGLRQTGVNPFSLGLIHWEQIGTRIGVTLRMRRLSHPLRFAGGHDGIP